MIIRYLLNTQHAWDDVNLTQNTIDRSFEQLHNNFIIGWVAGILLLVFSLICFLKLSNHTSKTLISNSMVERMWLILPAFILITIAVSTLRNLYQLDTQRLYNNCTLKTTGRQWYWSYEIIDHHQIIAENRLTRYIETSNNDRLSYLSREQELSLPNNLELANIVSATDVMHCWTLPNFLIKVDAIPGRINITHMDFSIITTGEKCYGQCSELCGANHSFMPISVVVL